MTKYSFDIKKIFKEAPEISGEVIVDVDNICRVYPGEVSPLVEWLDKSSNLTTCFNDFVNKNMETVSCIFYINLENVIDEEKFLDVFEVDDANGESEAHYPYCRMQLNRIH